MTLYMRLPERRIPKTNPTTMLKTNAGKVFHTTPGHSGGLFLNMPATIGKHNIIILQDLV